MNPESPYTQPGGQPNYQPVQMPQPAPQPGYAPVPPTPLPPVKHRRHINLWLFLGIVFIFTTVAMGALAIWALLQYNDLHTNYDADKNDAVAVAIKNQQDVDQKNFDQKEKQPNLKFVGPDDYGRLSFLYPKTWSVYVSKDASSGGDYEAYFNPEVVPPVSSTQINALHVLIQNQDYDQVINTYQSLVKSGALTSSAVNEDGQTGTRLDGAFNKNMKGSAVIFKIRDKTVTIQTQAQTFTPDFNALVNTITFNK